ncbi:hypothetical protein [Haladaptatus sp. AB643]|uniref:hypothetical protein n=1 Tax=Haladaptatus sp. AB643 TaxID=2934174 RepID=UPI00209C24C5|nr:hypothetical protein [Haladaptatus sp. AB643]MCO8245363.1 hypothetical protein [Haladaptatus sp. AB643]
MSSTNSEENHRQASTWEDGVAAKVQQLRPMIQPSPISGYEHVRGFGIYGLPLDTGHVLALRVFPENDFAPYKTIWHRTPDGTWSIYVDGPRHDTACPRYYGAATDHVESSNITLTWVGPMELRVEMDDPDFVLTVKLEAAWPTRIMNIIGARIPVFLWRVPGVAQTLAPIADRVFDVGDVTFVGSAPNGHRTILMPRQMYPIVAGSATLNGEDLGMPVRSETNPTIGNVALPAQPVLAIGEAYFEILDQEEYDRVRSELARQLST